MKQLFPILLAALCFSCNVSFNNYFKITDTQVSLVKVENKKHFLKTNYKADTCYLLDRLDTILDFEELRIVLSFSTEWIAAERGSPYGPYANLGNIDSILSFKIELQNENQSFDLSQELRGDPMMKLHAWKSAWNWAGPYRADEFLYTSKYVQNIDALVKLLNSNINDIGFRRIDFFFWIDEKYSRQIQVRNATIKTRMLILANGQQKEIESYWLLK